MGNGKGSWGRIGLLTLVIGAVLLGLFRFAYPDTPIDDAPLTLIIVLALVVTALADALWRRRGGKDGD